MEDYKLEEKESYDGKKVKILGDTSEPGKPDGPYDWKKKLSTLEDKLKFLKTGLRYWYSDYKEWYGSEKRKSEA